MNPTRRWRWHGVNLIPAIIAANRCAFDRFIRSQILFGNQTTVFLHLLGNLLSYCAFVKRVRAIFGNHLQALCQVRLHQLVALFQRLPLFPEDSLAVFVIRQHFATIGFEIVSQRIVNDKTITRQFKRGLNHFVQRHGAVFIQRQRETCYRARRAGGQMRSE